MQKNAPHFRKFQNDSSLKFTITFRSSCLFFLSVYTSACLSLSLVRKTCRSSSSGTRRNGHTEPRSCLFHRGTKKVFGPPLPKAELYMDVSENGGFPPKSSILIGFSIFFHHPFWGVSPLFLETPIQTKLQQKTHSHKASKLVFWRVSFHLSCTEKNSYLTFQYSGGTVTYNG